MKIKNKIYFVVGNSRSGTTMVSRILGNHTLVHTFQEIHFFESMVSSDELKENINYDQAIKLLNKLIAIQKQGFYKQIDVELYTKESMSILSSLDKFSLTPSIIFNEFIKYWSIKHHKSIGCEQTPKNVFYLKEINENFNNVFFINIIRDPRSVLLSQKNKWKRKYLGEKEMPLLESIRAWSLYHPFTIAIIWNSAIKASQAYENDNLLNIRFEDLLLNPNSIVNNMCNFLGLEFDINMLNVPIIGSSLGDDQSDKFGIDSSKLKAWDVKGLNNTEIYLVEKINNLQMERLGYEKTSSNPNYIYIFYLLIIFPIKIILSFILNIQRMKNLKESIFKRFFK